MCPTSAWSSWMVEPAQGPPFQEGQAREQWAKRWALRVFSVHLPVYSSRLLPSRKRGPCTARDDHVAEVAHCSPTLQTRVGVHHLSPAFSFAEFEETIAESDGGAAGDEQPCPRRPKCDEGSSAHSWRFPWASQLPRKRRRPCTRRAVPSATNISLSTAFRFYRSVWANLQESSPLLIRKERFLYSLF